MSISQQCDRLQVLGALTSFISTMDMESPANFRQALALASLCLGPPFLRYKTRHESACNSQFPGPPLVGNRISSTRRMSTVLFLHSQDPASPNSFSCRTLALLFLACTLPHLIHGPTIRTFLETLAQYDCPTPWLRYPPRQRRVDCAPEIAALRCQLPLVLSSNFEKLDSQNSEVSPWFIFRFLIKREHHDLILY